MKRKTDRDDALKLARLAAMNELKAVHMPSRCPDCGGELSAFGFAQGAVKPPKITDTS